MTEISTRVTHPVTYERVYIKELMNYSYPVFGVDPEPTQPDSKPNKKQVPPSKLLLSLMQKVNIQDPEKTAPSHFFR